MLDVHFNVSAAQPTLLVTGYNASMPEQLAAFQRDEARPFSLTGRRVMAIALRQLIQQVFSKHTLLLKGDALRWLEQIVSEYPEDDPQEVFEQLAANVHEHGDCADGLVDSDVLNRTRERLELQENDPGLEEEDLGPDHIRVIDAFDMPRLHFNVEKRAFEKAAAKPVVLGSADARAAYLRDRYNIIKQVVSRSEHFLPPAIAGHDRDTYLQITSIKNLLGRQGNRFLLFGMLTRHQDGRFCLEDLDDTVVLDLSEAVPSSGLFTEGAFLMVDGIYGHDHVFRVEELAHPPSEGRVVARSIYGHMDFLGAGAMTLDDETKLQQVERRIPHQLDVLSDVHLDNDKVLAMLRTYFGEYAQLDFAAQKTGYPTFVLCGNFSSLPFLYDGPSMARYQRGFDELAKIIGAFPTLQDAHFVLVPGPSDPWPAPTLPRPALPATLAKNLLKLPHRVTLASNPCRIQLLSQEVVVFRDDLMGRMLRNTVKIKAESDRRAAEAEAVANGQADAPASATMLEQFLVQTILDQAHLSPLPLQVQPVLWEHDHALRLYPMPTALVLADKYAPYSLTYELGEAGSEGKCHVFNPGSLVHNGFSWSTWDTETRLSQPSGYE